MKSRALNPAIAQPKPEAEGSAALFKAVLDASADPIYLYDRAGRYLYASPSGAGALGLSPADMLGKHWRELGLPPEIMQRFDAFREAVCETGKPVQARTRFPTLSGPDEYECWILPLFDGHGGICSTACIAHPIKEKPRTDRSPPPACDKRSGNVELFDSAIGTLRWRLPAKPVSEAPTSVAENHLPLVADPLPLLVSYVDTEQRYRFNNKAYQDWFGQSPAAIQGRSLREVLGKSAYGKIRQYVEAALAGQHVAFEQVVPYKDVGPRLIRAHYIPDRGHDGKVHGFFAVISDFTREGTQPDTASPVCPASSGEPDSRLAMLGEMTTEILHEIGQPLTAIASFSNAGLRLLRRAAQNRGEEIRKEVIDCLAEIQRQAARTRSMVRKLRCFLRSGRPSEAPVEVNRLIRAALSVMKPEIEAQQVTVDLRLMSDLCIISADRTLLEQVLVNLIRNAIDAMGDNCQPALKIDPGSASNFDPPVRRAVGAF